MSKEHDFVEMVMRELAGGAALSENLLNIFSRILSRQVTIDEDTNQVEYGAGFNNLLSVFTFVATESGRPGSPFEYGDQQITQAKRNAEEAIFPDTPDDNKIDPTDGLNDDAAPDDKSGIAQVYEEKSTGTLEISLDLSESVISLDDFRADSRFAGIDGSGYAVAILDTGIDLDHPAFGPDSDQNGVADRIVAALDFTPERDGTANDVQGHGTHVAGIIGSSAPNFPGVAPNVSIVALQVLDNENGSGWDSDIENALQWVAANAEALNIVAVNLSLGDGTNGNFVETSETFGDEFSRLSDNLGVAVVVAAGNSYETYRAQGASTMSRDPNSIAVGSVGGTFETADYISSFSQRSVTIPTLFSPGSGITSARVGGGEIAFSGTSMAAPHLAGMLVLGQQIAEQNLGRRLTMDEITALLSSSATRFIDAERPEDRVPNTGASYDRVDMLAFAEAILDLDPSPTTPPPSLVDIPGNISTSERIAVNQSRNSTIDFAGDRDFFEITLDPGNYIFDLQGTALNQGTLTDPLISLYTSTGAFITSDDDSGAGLDSRLEYVVSEGGTYYLSASAFGTATGSYTLTVTSDDDFDGEIPDNASTSSVIAIGSSQSSQIDFQGDADWFRVDLAAGSTYVFDLVGNTLSDPYLALYDEDGQLIAVDDDGGEGLNSSLQFISSKSGPYFLEARSFWHSETGSYTLTASLLSSQSDDFAGNLSTTGVIPAANGMVSGTLEVAGDTDWFRAELAANTVYTFGLTGGSAPGQLSDPLLRLYDDIGTQIAMNDDGGEGLNSELIYTTSGAETVFLSAEGYANLRSGSYVLTSSASGAGPGRDVPGDTSTTHTLNIGQTINGLIDQPGDTDWYAVNVQPGVTYQFELVPGSGANTIDDPYLALFNAAGQFLDSDDDGGLGLNSLLVYEPTSTGRVYISAETYSLISDQGTYELSLSASRPVDRDIPGDPSTTAILPVGGTVTGVLDAPGDTDWYEILFFQGDTIQIDLVGSGTNALADPFVELYGASGQFLASDDDGGAGLNSRLIYEADYTGIAYVSADSFANALAGTYHLSYTITSFGPATAASDVDIFGGLSAQDII
ncbi:MAG: S8 family serine peptidase [Lamprobacter sp.]|uniref:S8 family serine peptidase n=1 Tax=Lamprobacter sp. TaxID=3100796 RepID=UPI002B264265|nr:S8 family serine peptidase [Lamprobacter sp.]MEA3642210.1 S8 family serine peptidase [Lamprobacter sp.]